MSIREICITIKRIELLCLTHEESNSKEIQEKLSQLSAYAVLLKKLIELPYTSYVGTTHEVYKAVSDNTYEFIKSKVRPIMVDIANRESYQSDCGQTRVTIKTDSTLWKDIQGHL